MATIRQIVPSSAISEFRPVRQEGGNGFRLLAGAMDTAYEYLKPKAIAEMTEAGDALGREMAKQQIGDPAAAAVQAGMTPPKPQDPNAALGADAMAALGKGGEWLQYSNQGATRNDPLDPNLVNAMSFVGGMGITMDVVSGGQESNKPGEGTGSTRHNHGQSADVDFYKDGRKLDWNNAADLPVLQEIVKTAKSRGVTGIGAGDDYMGPGRFHVGFGAPAVWGADGKSANAPAWLVEAYNGAPQGTAPAARTGVPYTPPAVLRGADGKLSARLFGPTSNPIMAAHDAAAGAAWQSDVFLKAGQDFMSMSEQFALDPDGFKQASDEYVAAMVEQSPDDFKMDVRSNLEKEAGRRFLGMVDEKHRNIRERAANSTTALADRWADDLASAIATGDPDEVAAARSELASILAVKERLPGSTWTPEQSANYMDAAEEDGVRRVKTAQDGQTSIMKASLNTVIDAAKKGMTAADEAILDNPLVQQLLPELWREAAAFTTLRDQIPTFNMMTPAQQAAALAEMKDQPVQEQWEVDLYGAAETVAADNAKAWKADPIKRAGEVLTDEPPPQIPEFDPANPDAFMTALGDRAAYAQKLMDEGFTTREVYVSKDEAKMFGAIFGKEIPPEVKAMAAGAIVGAMGADAAGFFAQIKTTDPVIPHIGALMAMGGDTTVAVEAMTGQAYLDEKVVPAPSAKAVTAGRAKIEAAFMSVPGAAENMDGVSKTATAIYAARVPANADEETQAKIMEEAWQAALGQNDDLGVLRGGVQTIGDQQVLLPPKMAGEDLSNAMQGAFGYKWAEGFGSWVANGFAGPQSQGIDQAMWMKAAGGIPSLGGEPLDPALWERGEITMTPVGGSKYKLTFTRNGVVVDIRAQGKGDQPFIFDAEALVDASLVPK